MFGRGRDAPRHGAPGVIDAAGDRLRSGPSRPCPGADRNVIGDPALLIEDHGDSEAGASGTRRRPRRPGRGGSADRVPWSARASAALRPCSAGPRLLERVHGVNLDGQLGRLGPGGQLGRMPERRPAGNAPGRQKSSTTTEPRRSGEWIVAAVEGVRVRPVPARPEDDSRLISARVRTAARPARSGRTNRALPGLRG